MADDIIFASEEPTQTVQMEQETIVDVHPTLAPAPANDYKGHLPFLNDYDRVRQLEELLGGLDDQVYPPNVAMDTEEDQANEDEQETQEEEPTMGPYGEGIDEPDFCVFNREEHEEWLYTEKDLNMKKEVAVILEEGKPDRVNFIIDLYYNNGREMFKKLFPRHEEDRQQTKSDDVFKMVVQYCMRLKDSNYKYKG